MPDADRSSPVFSAVDKEIASEQVRRVAVADEHPPRTGEDQRVTMPPPLPPMPLPPLPAFVAPSFQQTKEEAKAILLAGADAPLPSAVRRHQERVLTRVRDIVDSDTGGHRLYVLEVAGPIPRVKIGRSNGPRKRIRHHVTLMNGFQYGLVDAHVTSPVDDLPAIARAENQAHIGVGKRYKRITQEEFRDADFTFAGLWADIAVQLWLNKGPV